jgi:TonB-linked SusC/RagA family outer membrane protein
MNLTSNAFPKSVLLLVLFLLVGTSALLAQRRVTGTIRDESGPLPGVNILVKGTTTGTASDENGTFELNVPEGATTLVISATGYSTQEVALGTSDVLDIALEEDQIALSEVVVTGYTVENRRQQTGAVSTVKSRDLTAIPSGNVEQQLQGRVAGVTVITNGQPGTTSQIRVRGFGSFGGNEPLYVVDGVPVGGIDFLAPDDIESTTVLKDAPSASIYGARAAGGVIVITTKKGQRGAKRLNVTYDGLYGVTDPGEAQAILNPSEQAEWTWNAIRNGAINRGDTPDFKHEQYGTGATPIIPDYINVGGRNGVVGTVNLEQERANYNVTDFSKPIYQVVRANKEGTNWYDAITRWAPLTRHSLGFSGASEGARFYASLGLQDQAGILIHNDFKRYTFRINSEFDLGKRIRIGENLQGTYRQVLGLTGGGGGINAAQEENDILQAFRMPSIIPVYDEFGGYAGTAAKGFSNPRNPVASRDGQRNDRNYNGGAFGNLYLEVEPVDGLTLRSSIGGGYSSYYYRFYGRRQYENSENNSSVSFGEGSGNFLSWVFTNTANLKRKFGVHGIDVLAGIEALNTGNGRTIDGFGLNPFIEDVNYVTLSNVGNRVVNSNQFAGVNFYSLFGRLNYNFNEKYYLTGVIRRDGSSRFGANNRYGVFPAVSAAWRVTSEEFMRGIDFITDLKIRGGWGEMGNSNNVNPLNQYNLFASSLFASSYPIDGGNGAATEGFFRSRIGNPNAQWETSTTTNIGFDASFFKGKLDFIFDAWRKDTEGLLFVLENPNTVGVDAAAPAQNIASMRNQGIDIQVINRGNIASKLGYELSATAAWLDNEITGVAPTVPFFNSGGTRIGSPVRNQAGQAISSFFGYQVVGLFRDAAEVASAPTQLGAAPGRFRFADLNGKDDAGNVIPGPDGKIDDADRTIIGSPVPTFQGGLNLKLTYGNFDLETYLFASLGNDILNFSRWFTDFYPSFTGAAFGVRVKDSWTPQNTNATTPIFEDVSNFSTNTQINSYYIEDGSFLRLQQISIGYNLPQSFLNNVGFRKLRIWGSVNNLFTATNYTGLDPAVGGAADTNFGIDLGNYPVTRSFVFGLNVGF